MEPFDLSEDEWGIVATRSSMATRGALLGVSRSARNAVVRSLEYVPSSDADGQPIRLLPDQVWARVQTVLLGRSNFVTGSAGVGKTTTSSTILDDLKHNLFQTPSERRLYERRMASYQHERTVAANAERDNVHRRANGLPPLPTPAVSVRPLEPRRLSVLTTATTGAAAQLLVDGQTLHSVFNIRPQTRRADGIRVVTNEPAYVPLDNEDYQHDAGAQEDLAAGEWYVIKLDSKLRRLLEELYVLLIDEISMLDADLFSLIDKACRAARPHKDAPFGGICVVLVGDFCQLAPVITSNMLLYGQHGFCFQSETWRALAPVTTNLTVPVRQDPASVDFIAMLNRARFGNTRHSDVDWLQANCHRPPVGGAELPLLLTTRTIQRKQRNDLMLARHVGANHRRNTTIATRGEMYLRRTNPKNPETDEPYDDFNDPRAWTRELEPPNFQLRYHKKVAQLFEFKIGARVRCTKNTHYTHPVSRERKLMVPNGAVGEILACSTEAGGSVDSIMVRWDRTSRDKPAFQYCMRPDWYEKIQSRQEHRGVPGKAVRCQFSLELCWGTNCIRTNR